jgi:acetate---CoA ligase (ADP-forming)
VGNQACVSAVECANVLLDSPKVGVIALYVEGLGSSGRDLLDLGVKARRLSKTVLVFKAGVSSLGRQLAVTHTGALSGPGDVIPTLISRAGLVYTETHEELADVMALESFASFEHRRALAVVSTGGGFTVMSADACSKYRVPLARLSKETSDKMRAFVPPFASVEKNPVDTTPFDAEGTGLGACEVLLQAPETDCVLLVLGGEDLARFLPRLRELAQRGRAADTPLIIGLAGVDGFGILEPTLKDAVAEAGIPVFGSPVRAVRALSLIGLSDPLSDAVQLEEPAADAAVRAPVSPLAPTPQYLNGILAKYGVSVPQQCVIRLDESLSESTSFFQFPVVLKLVDQGSSNHKTEKGWLRLNLKSPEELETAAQDFRELAEQIRGDRTTLRFQIQEQVGGDAVEVLVGATRHPEFGPVITVGTGGVLAELVDDVDYALAPIGLVEAKALLRRTKIGRRLAGYRGDRGYDENACAEVVVAVSKMLGELAALDEVEINPVIVGRSGAIAVDVRGTFALA